MALSNMLKEPRRELTEQFVGFGFIALAVSLDYGTGRLLQHWFGGTIGLDMAMGAVVLVLLWLGALLVHSLGEVICEILAERGAELRPARPEQSSQIEMEVARRARMFEEQHRIEMEVYARRNEQHRRAALIASKSRTQWDDVLVGDVFVGLE